MIKNFFDKENIEYFSNISLKKYNTFRIDSTCDYLVFPKDIEELKKILKIIKDNNIKYFILGNGSNIILSKEHYDGIVIKLDKFNTTEYNGLEVTVGAGYSLIKLSLETIEKGLSGLEFAAGIPGCIGASVAMNAGAYKSNMSNVVKSVKVLKNGENVIELNNKDLCFSYRNSLIKNNKDYIILSVTFSLEKGDILLMKEMTNERRTKRVNAQPLDYPSAGSVFRNPDNMFAGELIEKSNLKGFNINDAEISRKHANFIINKGNAKGKDVIELINIIKEKVKKEYDVELTLEQIIIE